MNVRGARLNKTKAAMVGALLTVVVATLGFVIFQSTGVMAATANVTVGSAVSPRNVFLPNQITINTGDTVQWNRADGTHDATEFANAWASPTLSGTNLTYSRAFPTAGVVWYYCSIHAVAGDIDTNGNGTPGDAGDAPDFTKMIGKITINQAPTATTGPTATPAPLPNASATGVYDVYFTQQPSIELSLNQISYGFGNVSPAAVANSAADAMTANVKSNGSWSLKFKSIGLDGVDQAPGDPGYDDPIFKNANTPADEITVGRLAVAQDGTTYLATTADDQVLRTGSPTSSTGVDTGLEFRLTLDYSDPVGNGSPFETTLLFTATSP